VAGAVGARYVNEAEGDGVADAVGGAVRAAPEREAEAEAAADLEADAEADADAPDAGEPDAAADGENIAGWVDPEVVHPRTATETRTVNVAAPAAGVARTFMEPPCLPGGSSAVSRPRHLARATATERTIAGRCAMACFAFDH
jgi:hypothetical protein